MRLVVSIIVILGVLLVFFLTTDKAAHKTTETMLTENTVLDQAESTAVNEVLSPESFDSKTDTIKVDPNDLLPDRQQSTDDTLLLFSKDLKAWPLDKCPDFWLLKKYVSERDLKAARQLLIEADNRPLPWHIRKFFSHCLTRIEFIFWLKKPARKQFDSLKASLEAVVDQLPEKWTKDNYSPWLGFVDSAVATNTESISTELLIASATAVLARMVQSPDNIASHMSESDGAMARYCQQKLAVINSAIPPLEINQRYAEVDFIVQSRAQFLPPGHPVARHSGREWCENVVANWSHSSIPACSGRLLHFFRHEWYCSKHHHTIHGLNTYEQDHGKEAWNMFLLANPEKAQYLESH